jgi:hypothetical protein
MATRKRKKASLPPAFQKNIERMRKGEIGKGRKKKAAGSAKSTAKSTKRTTKRRTTRKKK